MQRFIAGLSLVVMLVLASACVARDVTWSELPGGRDVVAGEIVNFGGATILHPNVEVRFFGGDGNVVTTVVAPGCLRGLPAEQGRLPFEAVVDFAPAGTVRTEARLSLTGLQVGEFASSVARRFYHDVLVERVSRETLRVSGAVRAEDGSSDDARICIAVVAAPVDDDPLVDQTGPIVRVGAHDIDHVGDGRERSFSFDIELPASAADGPLHADFYADALIDGVPTHAAYMPDLPIGD